MKHNTGFQPENGENGKDVSFDPVFVISEQRRMLANGFKVGRAQRETDLNFDRNPNADPHWVQGGKGP